MKLIFLIPPVHIERSTKLTCYIQEMKDLKILPDREGTLYLNLIQHHSIMSAGQASILLSSCACSHFHNINFRFKRPFSDQVVGNLSFATGHGIMCLHECGQVCGKMEKGQKHIYIMKKKTASAWLEYFHSAVIPKKNPD